MESVSELELEVGLTDDEVTALLEKEAQEDSWGIQWRPTMPHGDHTCPRCRLERVTVTNHAEHIVGFSRQCPPRTGGLIPAVGCVILTCPSCYRYFWYHVSYLAMKHFRTKCSQWPC